MRRIATVTASTLGAAIVLVGLAACTGSKPVAAGTSPSLPNGTTTVTATASPTATPTSSAARATSSSPSAAASTSSSPSGSTTCRTADLRLTFVTAVGASGTRYSTYGLTNVGSSSCTMIGYPGVSYVAPDGSTLNKPAGRIPPGDTPGVPSAALITLASGRTAQFLIEEQDNNRPNRSCPTDFPAERLRVYPPNQTAPLYDGSYADGYACLDGVGTVHL